MNSKRVLVGLLIVCVLFAMIIITRVTNRWDTERDDQRRRDDKRDIERTVEKVKEINRKTREIEEERERQYKETLEKYPPKQ